jgi:acyl dehydratase
VYFEDFKIGDKFELGSHTVTKEEIVRFAQEFDPQPFHVDEEAAKRSPFGGLIASGWHTASLSMRLLVDGFSGRLTHSYGSPGVDQIRWLVPMRPGDTMRLVAEIVEVRPSSSREDRGTIWVEERLYNQKDELVMTKRGMGIIARRP